MKNRIVLCMFNGEISAKVTADEEVEVFLVNDDPPEVFPLERGMEFGKDRVDQLLAAARNSDLKGVAGSKRLRPAPVITVHAAYRPRKLSDLQKDEREGLLLFTTGRAKILNDPDIIMRVHPQDLEIAFMIMDHVHRSDLRVEGKSAIEIGQITRLMCRELLNQEQDELLYDTIINLLEVANNSNSLVELSFDPKSPVISNRV